MGKQKCESLGKDKIVPMCWHAYRCCQSELFSWAGFESGSVSESDFAAWLGRTGGEGDGGGIVNALRAFMWYYEWCVVVP